MKLTVSDSPHVHNGITERKIFSDFIIALIPAVIYAVILFRFDAMRVITLAVSSAMIFEIVFTKLFKKPIQTKNGNVVFYGLIFALLLPASVPWWFVLTGVFLMIFLGREIFGGIGSNPFNPVLVGIGIVGISWPVYLDYNTAAVNYALNFDFHFPLTIFKKGGFHLLKDFKSIDLFFGKQVGGMGTAAIFLILIGGIYLIIRKRIAWEIPVFFFLGVLSLSALFWINNPEQSVNPLFHLLTGNVFVGAFFLGTDYSSAPVNFWGKVIFGFSCGFITVIFRAWSTHVDGVIYAVLVMNLFTPLLDKIKKRKAVLKVNNLEM